MSLRATAKVLGVSVATAYRDASVCGSEHSQDEDAVPVTVQGRDGRQDRKRKTIPECAICGDVHKEAPDDCPWDLFAQGRRPRPSAVADSVDRDGGSHRSADAQSAPCVASQTRAPSIVEALTRAVCIVDELDVLPELVDEIEIAPRSHDAMRAEVGIASSIAALLSHLRLQAETIARLVHRLERLGRAE